MEKKLNAMPYAQAKVIIMHNGLTILRSYKTNTEIDNKKEKNSQANTTSSTIRSRSRNKHF